MNVRLKFAVYIALTFLVGIAIGVLLNRALLQKKINDMLIMRASGRIVPRLEEIVKPGNPEQWKSIREILDKHESKMAGIHLRFREEIEAAFKSLKTDLDPLLTAEQRSLLEDMLPKPPPFFGREPRGFGFIPGRGPSVEEELSFFVERLGLSAGAGRQGQSHPERLCGSNRIPDEEARASRGVPLFRQAFRGEEQGDRKDPDPGAGR